MTGFPPVRVAAASSVLGTSWEGLELSTCTPEHAPGSLESDLQISRPKVARYMRLLEEVLLIKRMPGW